MKILLTGTTGYIGKRLVYNLLEKGYEVICCVRDIQRISLPKYIIDKVTFLEIDFLSPPELKTLPREIDGAYYLIHSMSQSRKDFDYLEAKAAENFRDYMNITTVKHVVYLSGIANVEELSRHLKSRKNVENILMSGNYSTTVLRAGIIVGSGSASFEIIRDLVEKLPIMLAPKWVMTRTQPIAVRNVISFLLNTLFCTDCYNRGFDIVGPDTMTYRDMLLTYAEVRHLKRSIIPLPIMTPRLSSYWLFFVTPVSFKLAANLVDSMKIEIIGEPNELAEKFGIELITYEEAIKIAFSRIEQNDVLSTWKDSMISGRLNHELYEFVQVPRHGAFRSVRRERIFNVKEVTKRIWSIGGDTGWYYATWLWRIRGFMDRLAGGVGLNRGRTNLTEIHPGDSLDFWRVLLADKDRVRLLLYAEMKLPGEAWLEFSIEGNDTFIQVATFRPTGIFGRIYWYMLTPFHFFIFRGMARRIAWGRLSIEIILKD